MIGKTHKTSGINSAKNRIPLFCAVTSMFWFSMYIYVPNLPVYARSVGASYSLVGLIVGSYGFSQMLLRIPLGVASDTLKKRKIFVIASIILCILSSTLFWFFQDTGMLLLSRALAGAAASGWLTFTILFSSYFGEKETTRAMGILSSFLSLGQVPAMVIGGYIAQRMDQRYAFLVSVIVALAALALSFGIKEKTFNREPVKIKQMLAVGKEPQLLVLSLLAVLSQFIPFATVFGFTPLVAKQLGADNFQIGLLATIYTAPAIIAPFLGASILSRYIGETKALIIGFSTVGLMSILTPYAANMAQLYILQAVCGFAQGFIFPLLMGLCIRDLDVGKRATAMGFFQAIYAVGYFVGPILSGALIDIFGLSICFWVIGFIALFSAAFPLWSGTVISKTHICLHNDAGTKENS